MDILFELVSEGLISACDAAGRISMSEAEFTSKMKKAGYSK